MPVGEGGLLARIHMLLELRIISCGPVALRYAGRRKGNTSQCLLQRLELLRQVSCRRPVQERSRIHQQRVAEASIAHTLLRKGANDTPLPCARGVLFNYPIELPPLTIAALKTGFLVRLAFDRCPSTLTANQSHPSVRKLEIPFQDV